MIRFSSYLVFGLVAVCCWAEDAAYTDILAIKRLTPKVAIEQPPVRLTGVVTQVFPWHPAYTSFTIASTNDPNGIAVFMSIERHEREMEIETGMIVTAWGFADFRRISPVVILDDLVIDGRMALPPVPRRRLADLHDELYFNQRIALSGVVRKLVFLKENKRVLLQCEVQNQDGAFVAFFQNPDRFDYDWNGLVDAEVRFTGCATLLDSRRKELQNKGLYLSDVAQVEVLRAAPADPFAKAQVLDDILFLQSNDAHRKLVRGRVILQVPGKFICIQNDYYGVRVDTADPGLFQVGDEVDVAGFLTQNNTLSDLTGCLIRRTGRRIPVEPVDFTTESFVESTPQGNERIKESEGRLVRVRGELVQVNKRVDTYTAIIFRHLGRNYRAVCFGENLHAALGGLAEGRPIEVTGVLVVDDADLSGPHTHIFSSDWHLVLRGAQDVLPLPGGPWLTPGRRRGLQWAAGGFLVFLVMLSFYLRRKVLNTDLILAERRRMAADLHDTLEQSMAATAMQLKAADDAMPPSATDAQAFLALASRILATAKTDLRNSVWNLRTDSMKTKTLEESIRDMAGLVRGIRVSCDLSRFNLDLPDSSAVHVFSIVQEAVANAIKHSGASELRIVADGDRLVISDNGKGFDPGVVPPGHFGLAGMRERAERFRGSVAVESAPGHGTRIIIWFSHGHARSQS